MKQLAWKCPNCASALTPHLAEKPYVLRCENGHSFDVAKQGYVNLLLPQINAHIIPPQLCRHNATDGTACEGVDNCIILPGKPKILGFTKYGVKDARSCIAQPTAPPFFRN